MATRRFKIANQTTRTQAQRLSAAALAYTPGEDRAPRVVASGQGKIAETILALAKQNDIPIYEDPALVAALSAVNPGDEIPPELYAVVASVLVYVYQVIKKRGI